MKRKLENLPFVIETRLKKRKREEEEELKTQNKSFVTGTDLRNYMLRDTLVDWLKLYKKIDHSSPYKIDEFFEFITQKGKDFETALISYLNRRKIKTVFGGNVINSETCQRVIQLMKEKHPVIHSAPFQNQTKKIRGIVDLLVRSDYLEKTFPGCKNSTKNEPIHYIVIDVKFSTLPLRADGIHLLNSGNYPAYKAQLWLYTLGIGEIQDYVATRAYIIGRRWKYCTGGQEYRGFGCLDKMGKIDYVGVDSEYVERTQNAIDWVVKVRENGGNWAINPPSVPELYPNMCVDSGIYNTQKREIAKEIDEITQVWYVGVKNREIALGKGINSWKDEKCTSQNLGIGGKRADVVDKILCINRDSENKILPHKITSNIYDWKNNHNEMFIDFETFCDVFSDFVELPESRYTNRIFMIGTWYKGEYKSFLLEENTDSAESKMMNEFLGYFKECASPKLWYWHAEYNLWFNACGRLETVGQKYQLQNWCDLANLFRTEPIVIKGCFKFGLKEVAKALYENKIIRIKIDSDCQSGLVASIRAFQIYNQGENIQENLVLKDIEKYNTFDVQVLSEILEYLRREHS